MNAITNTPQLSGFRRFSIEQLRRGADMPSIHSAQQLIQACAVRHWGEDQAEGFSLPSSTGALGLAQWLIDHADALTAPMGGGSLLLRGDMLERLLIGMMLPSDDVADAIAFMTQGAVTPEQWEDAFVFEGNTPSAMVQDDAPALDHANTVALPADWPTFGVLGGAVPPGRLFSTIADSRLPEGFLLIGCGMMVGLDESTALAMRSAIDAGIDHLRAVRGEAVAA